MDAVARRWKIKEALKKAEGPVSASHLAKLTGVSRQVIVGDIALLRATGCDIVATARGYLLPEVAHGGRFIGKVACQHSAEDTVTELYAIVDEGAHVLDVIVEHELYGEICGQLNLASRREVDAFLAQVEQKQTRLLSELTGGVHLHTLSCRSRDHFEQIQAVLGEKHLLFEGR